jgi:2-keto-4-pentenoate hydratase/2-oxohepta-3-ene-1,7-dioic acid hydratase in catechol pathway
VIQKKLGRVAALVAALLTIAAPSLDAQATRYVRFLDGDADAWGVLEGETIQRLSAAPYEGGTRTGQSVALSSVSLLAPATPKLTVILNVNYPSGVSGEQRPRPTLVTLAPRALTGHGSPILRPVEAEEVTAEPTIAIVIGRTAWNVSAQEAGQHIAGVVPALDVTAMDWRTGQWARSKSTDTFKPMGPALVSGVDYNDLTITGRHNGTAIPAVRTSDLIWDTNEIVEYVSRYMTLSPGDVIFVGTAGENFTVPIRAGDTLEVEVSGVGTLRSPVQAAPAMTTLPPPFQRPTN